MGIDIRKINIVAIYGRINHTKKSLLTPCQFKKKEKEAKISTLRKQIHIDICMQEELYFSRIYIYEFFSSFCSYACMKIL